MEQRPKYAKTPGGEAFEGVAIEPAPGGETPLTLRVTLGEMDVEEAFLVTLPATGPQTPVGEFLERVFTEDRLGQEQVRAAFDLKENPDLPEMYDALIETFREWRSGRCSLRFFANHGPELGLSDELWRHLRVQPSEPRGVRSNATLDLVIEQRYRALDYAVQAGYADSKAQLLEWLRDHTLLYFLDTEAASLEAGPESEDGPLLAIVRPLHEAGLLSPSEEAGGFAITEEGRRVLSGLIAETESYIVRYDVFGDVLYDEESGAAMFESGRGEDLRVPVYEAEGLDPVRVVFLLLMYESALDRYAPDWQERTVREEFFDEVLTPVVDHLIVEDAVLESIIESGFAYVEEQEQRRRGLDAQREVMARAKRADGLARE